MLSLAKISIFNDNPCLTIKKYNRWIKIEDIEKKIKSFGSSKPEYTIDDAKLYCKIFENFWKRIRYINNVIIENFPAWWQLN